jgi:hypothetical protein
MTLTSAEDLYGLIYSASRCPATGRGYTKASRSNVGNVQELAWNLFMPFGENSFIRVLDAPCVFDCTTKVVHELIDCPALEGVNAKWYAMVKDCLFMFYKWSSDMFPHVAKRFILSKYKWQSSTSDLSRLRIIDNTLLRNLPREIHEVHLFACMDSCFCLWTTEREGEDQHQIVRV